MGKDTLVGNGDIVDLRATFVYLQWNLPNADTTGTLSNCPCYRGVLSSEVDLFTCIVLQ